MGLGPTGNLQGIYAFLSLHTGRKISYDQFMELTMHPRVAWMVMSMALIEKKCKGLIFENWSGVELHIFEDGTDDDDMPNNNGTARVEIDGNYNDNANLLNNS